MCLVNVHAIEQVLIGLVVEIGRKRLVQMICSCPQYLIRASWCSLLLALDHRLVLWSCCWEREVRVSVQVVFLELDRFDVHRLNLFEILLVV